MISTLPRKERKHAITQLRLLIEQTGVKQAHIARELKIEQPSLSKWLNGRGLPGDKWTPRILGYVAKQSPAPSASSQPASPSSASLTKRIERARRAVALAASLLDELAE